MLETSKTAGMIIIITLICHICHTINTVTKDAFHLTELTSKTSQILGRTNSTVPSNEHTSRMIYMYTVLLGQKNARDCHTSVPSNCCIFFAN